MTTATAQQQHQQQTTTTYPQSNSSNNNNNNNNNGQTQQPQDQAEADQPKKAKRKRITPEQLEDLVGLFEKTDTPSFEVREKLAKKLGMSNREIQVWFQNRRAKANRVKINEQAALHHQQHLQHQQMQQQQQQHHMHHHRTNSGSNGYGPMHPGHVHSAPSTPMQAIPVHHQPHPHHHHSQHQQHPSNGHAPPGGDQNSFSYFGPNGSSPPMAMPTPTPRAHSSMSHPHGGQPNRRPASLYNIGSYGHLLQTQQFQQQQKPAFQPLQQSSTGSHYGHSAYASQQQPPQHGHGHSHSRSGSTYGMDIILPSGVNPSSTTSASQRHALPPPISTLGPRRPEQSIEDYEESRTSNRHERTMSEGHPAGYLSPNAMTSPISPPVLERHVDNGPYREEYEPDSPSSATQSSPFTNGGNSTAGTTNNRHSASFGLKPNPVKAEEVEPKVVLREPRSLSNGGGYYSGSKNRRSYDDALYDEHQQLMRDNFNMDTRLVITEDEPRPESAIDLLAYAAAYVQESEEHKKEGSGSSPAIKAEHGSSGSGSEDKRNSLGLMNPSNKRQSFHGPTGYPSKEPFHEEPSSSSRYSSSSMSWEASGTSAAPSANAAGEVMPVPRQRNRDGDSGFAARRPRPVTYGGSGFLYDHHENQFMPQTMSPSLSSSPSGYGRSPSSSSARRVSNHRNSQEVGSSGMLLQRGLTRPRRSSSTATQQQPFPQPNPQFYAQTPSHPSTQQQHQQSMVLPPILSENQRLLSPAMVPSPPPFGSSASSGPSQNAAHRLSRHDSYGSNSGGFPIGSANTQGGGHPSYPPRDSPGSDSYSRESYNDSRGSREDFDDEVGHKDHVRVKKEMEDEEMEDEDEYSRQRAAKRRSGHSFFGTALQ
ncbi:hypothetical protein BGZ83_006503 [Gryganskiella cystojenkinii]|nr:hypothetical protein BGZ83_006503 [Gryganskiella cystojenkinii]